MRKERQERQKEVGREGGDLRDFALPSLSNLSHELGMVEKVILPPSFSLSFPIQQSNKDTYLPGHGEETEL